MFDTRGFSRYPSIPSLVVIATAELGRIPTGDVLQEILHLVFGPTALGNALIRRHRSPLGLLLVLLPPRLHMNSAHVATHCRWVLTTLTSCTVSSWVSGQAQSASHSCDGDAAACGANAAGVSLLSLSFPWSHLCNSSANATFGRIYHVFHVKVNSEVMCCSHLKK